MARKPVQKISDVSVEYHVRQQPAYTAAEEESGFRLVNVGPQGRVVLPAVYRVALGLGEGDQLVARVDAGRLVLETRENILRRLQVHVRGSVRPGVSLADELVAERRTEARREAEESEAELRSQGRDPEEVFARMESDSRRKLEARFGGLSAGRTLHGRRD